MEKDKEKLLTAGQLKAVEKFADKHNVKASIMYEYAFFNREHLREALIELENILSKMKPA